MLHLQIGWYRLCILCLCIAIVPYLLRPKRPWRVIITTYYLFLNKVKLSKLTFCPYFSIIKLFIRIKTSQNNLNFYQHFFSNNKKLKKLYITFYQTNFPITLFYLQKCFSTEQIYKGQRFLLFAQNQTFHAHHNFSKQKSFQKVHNNPFLKKHANKFLYFS